MNINYVNGDATDPQEKGTKIIVHCCNDIGAWGAGFVLAISKKWKEVEMDYRKWASTKNDKNSTFKLGNYRLVKTQSNNNILVCNLIGQQGVGNFNKTPPVRYEALRQGMQSLSIEITNHFNSKKDVSIHMPRLGCGLAGGKWEFIEPIIIDVFINKEIPVTVYDFN